MDGAAHVFSSSRFPKAAFGVAAADLPARAVFPLGAVAADLAGAGALLPFPRSGVGTPFPSAAVGR